MDIIFNCLDSGLGNNGGSRTIVRSANTLKKLGHNVVILNPPGKRTKLDLINNKTAYTWDTINVPVMSEGWAHLKADVIIATAYASVKTTVEAPDSCGMKVHWMRGWETWKHSEEWIKENVLNQPTLKIVNSLNLQDKLKEYNVESKLIRPGYDFDELKPLHTRETNKVLTLGALYNKGNKRKEKRVDWIFEAVEKIKKDITIALVMFGGEGQPPINAPIDLFIPNPIRDRKNNLYNRIDIWLAPTENDSLHLPPAEAMITECCIVGTDTPMNGMKDYLINMETGLISMNSITSFENTVRLLINDIDLRIELGKNAREKILSLGTREYNMNILLNYLEDNML